MNKTLEYLNGLLEHEPIDWDKTPVILPSTDREWLAKLFFDLKFTTGVEVGVKEGEYSEMLCKENPNLRLYCIDPWDRKAYAPGVKGWPIDQESFDQYYKNAVERLKPYHAVIVRRYSTEAVKYINDKSLDFVYIDGNHNFQHVTNDIAEWSKKIRRGGIISGHDYTRFPRIADIHVKYVVEAYTAAMGIKPWFVLGTAEEHEGFKRDKSRSWFWVKE